MVEKALFSLGQGDFEKAGQYLNQAFNQKPENAQIYIGQLMINNNVRNIEELIENLSTPLENEELFQRALSFAKDDNEKAQLEFYARASQKKLEQKRLAEEAEQERQRIEQERIRAEQEAEKERRYQEILTLKEKASTIQDFNELLNSIRAIGPYKDAEKIYEEVKEALNVETKYQNVKREVENGFGIANLQNAIKDLEELDDYKDSEKLLEEAQSKLEALEEYSRKMKKRVLIFFILAIVVAGSYFGWQWYQNKTARENAMIAFFEERYEEANEAIKAVQSSGDNPVLLNILAYIDYDKSGSNYEKLKNKAEELIKNNADDAKNYYSDALTLSEKYLSKIPANKFQGDFYLNGWGADKDANKAVERFKVAAESGDIYSQEMLVKIYDTVLNDPQSAMQWYQKLAENGNAKAQLKVADMLFDKGDYNRAAELYLKLGENGSAVLQNRLGDIYHKGQGLNRNYSEAAKWYEKAANQGLAEAQDNLGAMYEIGRGVEKNYSKAFSFYNKAAVQGNIHAQERLGFLFENGLGVTKNKESALEWYKNAADQGNMTAKSEYDRLSTPVPTQNQSYSSGRYSLERIEEWYELGNQYLEDKNYSPALKYFRWAADENYAPAQDKLGWMYQNGWGVDQDYSKARELYLKAANQGNHFAQASIGLLYYKGWGVQQDLEEALKWYKKAAAQGHETAIKRVKEIEREIYNRNNQQEFSRLDYQGNFPVAATIFGNKVNVRRSPTTNSSSVNRLNSGHPVSVSRRSSEYDGDWYHVKTASGTEGWVKADYVALNNNVKRTQQELDNRRKSLPARGVVSVIRIGNRTGDKLNLRNIPSTARTAKVITEMTTGDGFTAYEIFAEGERDWYRIRTDNYEEGWVSGRFIQLR